MSASSSRGSRLIRRTISSASRRGLQFVRRATLGGVAAASVFAASDAFAQNLDIPPAATGQVTGSGMTIGGNTYSSLTMNGGAGSTLSLVGSGPGGEGFFDLRVTFYDHPNANPPQTSLANIAALDALVANTTASFPMTPTNVAVNIPINFATTGGDPFGAIPFTLSRPGGGSTDLDDTWFGVWTGKLNITTAGTYSFFTTSDDGSAFWIDLDNNGTFDGAGENVVINNFDQGMTERGSGVNGAAAAPTLNPGVYNVKLADNEGGGDAGFIASWTPAVGPKAVIPLSPPPAPILATTVTVNGSSTFDSDAKANPVFSSLTVPTAGLTITKTGAGGVQFAASTLPAGTTTFSTTTGRINVGALNTQATTVVAKTGAGTLAAGPSTTVNPATSFNISAGTFEVTNNVTSTSLGGAPVTLSGGRLFVNPVANLANPAPGLLQGRVAGAFNITNDNPGNFGIVLEPIRAQVVGNGNVEPFPDNTTYIYTGQMFFPDNGVADGMSQFAFAECFDDSTQIKIDGVQRLNNTVWNVSNTTGELSVTAGWHDVEFRFGEGGGGWGPSGQDGWVQNPAPGIAPGFGMDFTTPIDPGSDTSTPVVKSIQANFQRPVDPGDGTLFRTGGTPVFGSNVTVTENSIIGSAGGPPLPFGNLSVAAGKTLTVEVSNYKFQDVNLNAGNQTFTINTGVTTGLGRFTDGANTGVTLTKNGPGTLLLNNGANDLSNTNVVVTAGTVQVTNTATGANPLGPATVQLNGGTMILEANSFAPTGISLGAGGYTGKFYKLATGTGSNAFLGTGLDPLTPVETDSGILAINFPSSNQNPYASAMANPALLQDTAFAGDLQWDDHSARFTGNVVIATAQDVNFFTNSDDGSVLWVDRNGDLDFNDPGEEVVDNRGDHGMQVRSGTVPLTPGTYAIQVDVYERGGGSGLIAGWQGAPTFSGNNISVTANSTLNVAGTAGGTTVGNISMNSGVTLTKTGQPLTAGTVTLAGNATINDTGNISVASISDGTATGTFTKAGGGTTTIRGAGDLSGTTVNVTGGLLRPLVADSLANSPGINISGGAILAVAHADAVSVATPVTVARGSAIDFEVPMTSSRKITVAELGGLVGQLDNLSYGTGAGQVGLANNAVLAPDAGETLPAQSATPGHRLLLGMTANGGTWTHGTETSTGPGDLYRGIAIGNGWTPGGNTAAIFNGPAAGGDLNIYLAAAPGGQMAGNNTFKNVDPDSTQFNVTNPTGPTSNKVNVLGEGRMILIGGQGSLGGNWTIMNRTGNPNFRGANNVLLELGGATSDIIGGGKTVNIRHGSFNMPGGGGLSTSAVNASANINIAEGGTIVMDDTRNNSPTTGFFNIAGLPGTFVKNDATENYMMDLDGDGITQTIVGFEIVPDPGDVSVGKGAIYISINSTGNTNADGSPLNNTATWSAGVGFLMILDNDQSAPFTGITTPNNFAALMPKADIIIDSNDANSYGNDQGIVLGNGRRLTTTYTNNALVDNNGTIDVVRPDPSLATTPGAKVILSASPNRTLDINDPPNFTGIDVQIGDPGQFETIQGLGGDGRAFDQLRVARVTAPQTGRVGLQGLFADDVILESGSLRFEDNINPTITGNFIIREGTFLTDNNANIIAALQAGNFGRAGAEIQLADGGAFMPEFERVVQTVATPIRTTEAGRSYIVLDEGGGSAIADVTFNVTLAPNSAIDLGLFGTHANMLLRANVTAGVNGAIENNESDTQIHAANVNAPGNAITFAGSRLTQLDALINASSIKVGDGAGRSGRLAIANLAHIGALPITVSPSSHLAFNPGTGVTMVPPAAQITQGSGTLRAQSGIVDFGTAVVTGATVAATAPAAGLQHSILPGAANLTEPNANVDVQRGPLAATTPPSENTFGPFGQTDATHVYTGQFFDADGIVAFAEHFDDTVLLRVNGRTLLNDGRWDFATASPDDDAGTPGLQTNLGAGLGGGWHSFELRLGQGGGGVGAPGLQQGVDWPVNTFGFGFNPTPASTITSPLLQSNYQPMLDNGSMNLFRWTSDPGAGDLWVDGNAKMTMGGFANQDSLTLAGNGANLTLVNSGLTNTLLRTNVTGTGTVDVPTGSTLVTGASTMANSATLTKLGGGTMTIDGPQTNGTATAITVTAGVANINTNAGTNTARNTTVNANSTTNFGSTQHLAALNVGAGATATLTAGGPKNLVTNALTIAGDLTPTGKLDITNNGVVVDYPVAGPSPEATIRAQIIAGRGGINLDKTWNGLGITSSTAGTDPINSMSVGYAVAGTMPLGVRTDFRGQAVDPTSVIMRYTRTGDADLDGVVDEDDVTVLGANYAPGTPKPRWDLGDFDYDGSVDEDDVTLLGVYYNPTATPIPAPEGGGVAAVPEPATWLMLTIGGLGAGLVGWRRRRKA